jgi:hypothetical protein
MSELERRRIFYWAPQRQAITHYLETFGARWRAVPIFNAAEVAGIQDAMIFDVIGHPSVVPEEIRHIAHIEGWIWIKIDDSAARIRAARRAA